MKKALKFSVIVLLGLFLVGCGTKEDYVVKCSTSQKDVVNGYETTYVYEVTTDGKIVKNVVSTETVISDNETTLKTFETNLKELYDTMNKEYGGYTNNITMEKGKLTSVTKIDYTVLDLDKLVKDQPTMKSFVNKSNKITLDGIKTMYTSLGATCDAK